MHICLLHISLWGVRQYSNQSTFKQPFSKLFECKTFWLYSYEEPMEKCSVVHQFIPALLPSSGKHKWLISFSFFRFSRLPSWCSLFSFSHCISVLFCFVFSIHFLSRHPVILLGKNWLSGCHNRNRVPLSKQIFHLYHCFTPSNKSQQCLHFKESQVANIKEEKSSCVQTYGLYLGPLAFTKHGLHWKPRPADRVSFLAS